MFRHKGLRRKGGQKPGMLIPSAPYSGLLSVLAGLPGTPSKFTQRYIADVIARCNRRINVLPDRIGDIAAGRIMPDRDDITIGSGRQFTLTVLFLDICSFSSRPNWLAEDQKTVLSVMNVFMAEMLSIVHDFGGTYEKNTGDGLMAYFGEGEKTIAACVKPAVEAAVIMHYVNDQLITPWFQSQNVEPVIFRVGIDYGPVTIARVGIHGEKSSLVAIGTPANIANKLMNRIPNGGICIGDEVRNNLPNNWTTTCKQCSQPSGFVYVQTSAPYLAWELNHRLSPPIQ
jgi:adenylate cyclase